MADIRKRQGKKGVTYQVRYPNASTKAGYSFKTFRTMKEARAFSESSSDCDNSPSDDFTTVDDAIDLCERLCVMVMTNRVNGAYGVSPKCTTLAP